MVGHSQGTCYHIKAQEAHVKEQMEFVQTAPQFCSVELWKQQGSE